MEIVNSKGSCKGLQGRYLKELLDGQNIYEGVAGGGGDRVVDLVKKAFESRISKLESVSLKGVLIADEKAYEEHFRRVNGLRVQKKYA